MPKTTAEQEYQEKKKDVGIMLTKITLAFRAHAKKQSAQKAHWGFVGDLDHVLKTLAEVNRFLRNEQE